MKMDVFCLVLGCLVEEKQGTSATQIKIRKKTPLKTRIILLFFVCLIATLPSFSQTVSGQWYGVGNVSRDGNYSQYLSELILKQKGDKVTGEFNYFFKSAYIPARVSGTYNSKTRVLELHIIPLLNFKAANINGADCPMQGFFILKVSKVETTLAGQFETTDHYKYTCPEIVLKFKKEILTSEDKKKLALKKEPIRDEEEDVAVETMNNEKPADPVILNTTKTSRPTQTVATAKKPEPNELTVAAAPQPNAGLATKKPGNQTSPTVLSKKVDSIELKITKAPQSATDPVIKKLDPNDLKIVAVPRINDTPQVATLKPKPPVDPTEAITKALNKRSFEQSPIIEVNADSITLTMYDNGEVDGDTVALFHNRKLLVRDQRLSDKPIPLTIHIDTTVHEISMYAENLGAIPPNTALCVIMVGEKRYELVLSSNFIRNGTIRFRKKTQAQINAEKEYLQ
jgi:hypothetical protein